MNIKNLRELLNETEQMKGWQNYVKRNKMLKGAVTILRKIEKKGYKAFIVGGAVRDLIFGKTPGDIDIATNMPVIERGYGKSELEKAGIIKPGSWHTVGRGEDFGIAVINFGGFSYELAQFRRDGKYKDGRRPETVSISGSFEEDAERRDFTINAMGIDHKGNIIDFFDGKRDLKNKVLRTVGDPEKRFGEDYLRMIRAARFSSRFGMKIDPKTIQAAQRNASKIMLLAPERIKDEIMKAGKESGDKFASFIVTLDHLGILEYVLPEVVRLKAFRHSLETHPEGGVWDHTIAALRVSKADDPIKNLAILLHDIGKAEALTFKGTEPKYYEHARKGVDLVHKIADRLKLSNTERSALEYAIANHMRFHEILKMKPSKVAKLVASKDWDILMAVARADELARGKISPGDFEKIVDQALVIKKKWTSPEKVRKLVDGRDIMKITGLKPGPEIGRIIKKTTEWIIDNNVKDQSAIDAYIKKMVGIHEMLQLLDEAAYTGNMGFEELARFWGVASPSETALMEKIVKSQKWNKFQELIKKVLGVQLKGRD